MKLSKILSQTTVGFKIASGLAFVEQAIISGIAIDSRLVKKNSIFFALEGCDKNGKNFIPNALTGGAVVLVSDSFGSLKDLPKNVILIETLRPRLLLAAFLKIFYAPLPANIYAITGTNGKTSTAEFTRQILEFLGKKSASIGTLGIKCNQDFQGLQTSNLTTPDIVSLYKNLQILQKNGINDIAIEMSSIGLEQGRADGLKISVAAFTNFTQDHLDYHKTHEEYFRCKMLLFEQLLGNNSPAVLNSDIPEFPIIKKICEDRGQEILEYGFKARHLRLHEVKPEGKKQKIVFEFQQEKYHFYLTLSGEFQAFNALCALGIILAQYPLFKTELKNLLSNFYLMQPAAGRMQLISTLPNQAQVFIDFAHSPDALKNVLRLARKITRARVFVLFGCGGNRDDKKRPIMGRIACDLADLVIITDDNPRYEPASSIRSQILVACDKAKTLEIADRKIAIARAVALLGSRDILILAGKGHEKYQIIQDQKIPFDEEQIVRELCQPH